MQIGRFEGEGRCGYTASDELVDRLERDFEVFASEIDQLNSGHRTIPGHLRQMSGCPEKNDRRTHQ